MQFRDWCAGSSWGWRWPFVLVALPALGVAAIMLVTTREPPRGGTEAALSVRSRNSPQLWRCRLRLAHKTLRV